MKFRNANVLITGGASGIGKIMGRIALEKGADHLIIWDINPVSVESAKHELGKLGKVKGYIVDVSDNKKVTEAYQQVVKDCGEDEILRTMHINTIAPMFVARAMLPDMLKRNVGHICTIASAGGMLSNPKMSVYAASKWGVIGWSDSVRIELQEMKSKVRVTTIAPYYINTGMFNGVKSRLIPILKPEYVAKKVVKAIEKNKIFRGIPFGFHFIRFWQTILPVKIFDFFFGKVFGIYHAMDDFQGRK